MTVQDLTVDIKAALTVSDEMANRCLRLLEMWQADHPDQRLMSVKNEDGSIKFTREHGVFERIESVPFKDWYKRGKTSLDKKQLDE